MNDNIQNDNIEINNNKSNNLPKEESLYGILAIVFGALGGWLGLVFALIGLHTYKETNNRRNCYIGLGLFVGWIIIIFLLVMIAMISIV